MDDPSTQDLLLQLIDKPKPTTQDKLKRLIKTSSSHSSKDSSSTTKKQKRVKKALKKSKTTSSDPKRKLPVDSFKATKKRKTEEEKEEEIVEDNKEKIVEDKGSSSESEEENEEGVEQNDGESSLNTYLQYELNARQDLVDLKNNYKFVQGDLPFSKGTNMDFYKRVVDTETVTDGVDLFGDFENFEKHLVGHHGIDPSIASGLTEVLNKKTISIENKKIACQFADALFSNMSVVDMTNKRPAGSKMIKKFVYMAKILNQVIKSRQTVKSNNSKLAKMTENERFEADFRDRGLVKPKALVLLPMKNDALELVNDVMLPLIKSKETRRVQVENHKRFNERCGLTKEEEEEFKDVHLSKKPEDFKDIFRGNMDDDFIIPIKINPNKVKLYCSFYQADIIIASPVALKQKAGHKSEKHYDSDFLASLQTVVVDEADVINMQSWTNLHELYKLFHLKVENNHDTDINRIYMWALAGHSKHYCQHVVLSAVSNKIFASLATRKCHNYKGLIIVKPTHRNGSIADIMRPILQHYYRFKRDPTVSLSKARFDFFANNIFKDIRDKKLSRVLIYADPFDYLTLRSFMLKKKKDAEGVDFGYFNEYSEDKLAKKCMRDFVKGKTRVLLYSERYHFYKRPYLKGIEHVVFYNLPAYPHYYSEMVNMIRHTDLCEDGKTFTSVRVLYHAESELMELEGVLGASKAEDMVENDQDHVILVSKK